jgi:protein-disulfide isomerase
LIPRTHSFRSIFAWGLAVVALLAFGPALPGPAVAQSRTHTRAAHASSDALPAPVKSLGSKTAPITMEVFSDYQCPSCRSLYEQTLRPMMNDYVAAGKVYLVHRDFPLPMHAYSHQAARWANAAARIGKFEEVDAALYDNQTAWSADGNVEKYVAGALSTSDFKRLQRIMEGCEAPPPTSVKPASLKSGAQAGHGCSLDAFIDQDVALGKQIPVQATPTFVIYYKGQRYPAGSGYVSWPILKQFFDSLLSQ